MNGINPKKIVSIKNIKINMEKSKILIQLFPMVDDIDQLEKMLLLLRQNSLYIDR